MISVESLKVEFGVKPLFTGASFVINERDRIALVGKNGAGKTTFFRYIMDEKKRYNGSFFLGGRDISEDHVWLMNHVGFVSEDNTYFMRRTAFQNVDLLKDFYSEFDMELFLNVMKLVNFMEY